MVMMVGSCWDQPADKDSYKMTVKAEPRVLLGACSDHPAVSPLLLTAACTALCTFSHYSLYSPIFNQFAGGVSAFLLPISSTFLTSAGLAFLFGSSQAALWALTTPIVVDMQVAKLINLFNKSTRESLVWQQHLASSHVQGDFLKLTHNCTCTVHYGAGMYKLDKSGFQVSIN